MYTKLNELRMCKWNTKELTNCIEINAVERVYLSYCVKFALLYSFIHSTDASSNWGYRNYVCAHLNKLYTLIIVCCLMSLYIIGFNHEHF